LPGAEAPQEPLELELAAQADHPLDRLVLLGFRKRLQT
jgi:hypothetical protein